MSDSCFELEGWDEFVERFSQFVDKWEAKKAQLLKKMGNIYHSEVIPHVPVDTSHLVSNIFVLPPTVSRSAFNRLLCCT